MFLILRIQSNQQNIIADHVLMPRIVPDQYSGVYVKGESATLTCSSLSINSGSPFNFYRNRELLTPTDEGGRWARLRIDHMFDWDQGLYTCRDSRTIAGRQVLSPYSRAVELYITGNVIEELCL